MEQSGIKWENKQRLECLRQGQPVQFDSQRPLRRQYPLTNAALNKYEHAFHDRAESLLHGVNQW
eukprot:7719176-Pyramimonas_sp.AAC.1